MTKPQYNTARLILESKILDTLKGILRHADFAYLKDIPLTEFEQSFIDEVHFFLPCDEKEMRQVERYIRGHAKELLEFCASNPG